MPVRPKARILQRKTFTLPAGSSPHDVDQASEMLTPMYEPANDVVMRFPFVDIFMVKNDGDLTFGVTSYVARSTVFKTEVKRVIQRHFSIFVLKES